MRKEERVGVARRMLEIRKYVLEEIASISGLPIDEAKNYKQDRAHKETLHYLGRESDTGSRPYLLS